MNIRKRSGGEQNPQSHPPQSDGHRSQSGQSLHGDVYSRDCPCRELLDVISGRWSVLLIESLQAGPMRFGELQRRMEGISAKVLTANLRRLECAGLISRQVFAEVPVRVEYSLTPEGLSAVEPLRGLRVWAESHYDQALALTAGSAR